MHRLQHQALVTPAVPSPGRRHRQTTPTQAGTTRGREEAIRLAETVTETSPVRQEPVRQSEPAVRQAAREKSNNELPVKQPTGRKAYLRNYMRDYMRKRRAEAKAPQTVAASS
jgi:hypothetical protein